MSNQDTSSTNGELERKLRILIPRGVLTDEDGAKYNNDVLWSLIHQYAEQESLKARIEGRIEAGVQLRKSMISTSPFVEQILNPYITEQRRLLKPTAQLNQLEKGSK